MVQSLDDARRQRNTGTACTAARLGGRGVAARRHVAVAQRHRRRGRGAPHRGGLLQAGARPHLRGDRGAVPPGRPGRPRHRRRRAAPRRPARSDRWARLRSSRCKSGTPAISNASRYARIVEEFSLLRRLIGVAGEIAELGYSLPDDVTAVHRPRRDPGVRGQPAPRLTDDIMPVKDLLADALDKLEALYERGEAVTGVPTGFTRPRRAPRRPAAQQPDRGRRPPGHG